MEELIKYLKKQIKKLKIYSLDFDNLSVLLKNDVYPFNKFEYIISHLLSEKIITLDDYLNIRSQYLERNKYLYVFEITAPRTFGETWAQRQLNILVPDLKTPSKVLDNKYSGEYDFWYDNIKIEVKASRAVKRSSGGTLFEKALSSSSNSSFNMNFQQLKPDCADVFVFIAVWRDKIRYWVLSSNDIKTNIKFSKGQHRGNQGEGQLWFNEKNINEFDIYEVKTNEILDKIIEKSK